MLEVDFFFDCTCPWSYLAFTRLQETATRTGAEIIWKPIVVQWVLEATNSPLAKNRQDPNPRKARYQAKDLQDWAVFCDLEIEPPAEWPVAAEPAMRGVVAALDADAIVPFARGVFAACFGARADVADPGVLRCVAESAGMDGEGFVRRLSDPKTLHQLRANSDELIDRGGFGSPTMFVGDDMYFGNDRMPLVEFALGQASGRKFVMPGDHTA